MTKKTIAKFRVFVIFAAAFPAIFSACGYVASTPPAANAVSHYDQPKVIGTVRSSDITESSGLAASRCQKDVIWTHNDSGDDAFIFAINAKGEDLGTWKVTAAQNIDWEDIASYKDRTGKCFIYIGEIGDNKSKRHEHYIYRVPEPQASAEYAGSSREAPMPTVAAEVLGFTYPDYDQDSETLIVRPDTGDIYVVTKRVSGPAGIYLLKPDFSSTSPQNAEKIGELSVPAIPNGFLTGGDISPDGRRVVICDYTQAYEYTLPDGDKNFDDIWKQEPETVDIGKRKVGESITYTPDGLTLLAGSEGKNSPIINIHRSQNRQ